MNATEFFSFNLLGISVLVHIAFVNITMGTGWISAMARFLAWRRNDASLEIMSRRVFKILIVHELFSGVWGTIITVVLAGFFPTLLAIATDVIFYPILIAVAAIIIRIPSIALFWYSWGKVQPGIHSALGFVMALSGFAVPMGFRYIFTEITYPHGVGIALGGSPDIARFAVFYNPLYPPLILHTWMGAMSVGGFITASFFVIKGNTSPKFLWIGLWHGVLFLAVQPLLGLWYLLALGDRAPILYNNILGTAQSTVNLLPMFIAKLLVVAALAGLSYVVWRSVKRGAGVAPRHALALGPLAVLTVLLGEYMNDGGRSPYLVLLGETGLPPATFSNIYIRIPFPLVFTILAVLVVFLFGFMATVYYALNRRFLEDLPEA
ncbi:MAG: cytochrome ubiquinol oxidase subunit I [Nitrososphaerota archaeon]|nr:cytochrome ubiquinol oxidase subunit I [Candidatus Calditenuaceae archaeon]MDW8074060.1 cytochrome ubiquinol oxidase subunit I [Nitrososphaerota archaeon]